MTKFPQDPYEGQVYYDPITENWFEYWIPDEFCKSMNVEPKWIVKSFEGECVAGLFSKDGKTRYFSYNKLIDEFGYTKEQISELMEELRSN